MCDEAAFLHEDEEAGVFYDSDGFIVKPIDASTPEALETKLQELLQPIVSVAESKLEVASKTLSRVSSTVLRSVRSRVKSARPGGIRKDDLAKLNQTVDREEAVAKDAQETKDTEEAAGAANEPPQEQATEVSRPDTVSQLAGQLQDEIKARKILEDEVKQLKQINSEITQRLDQQ